MRSSVALTAKEMRQLGDDLQKFTTHFEEAVMAGGDPELLFAQLRSIKQAAEKLLEEAENMA